MMSNLYTQKKQPTLSVVMMIYNEAARLAACLERLRFADEIVILDSGSTDTSLAICRQFGATIYAGDWPGFVAQRNRVLQLATGDWILSVDADELVSPELALEIRQRICCDEGLGAYRVPRRHRYYGQLLCHGLTSRDRPVRLFRRNSGRWCGVEPHDHYECDGPVGMLHSSIEHIASVDPVQHALKDAHYAQLAASQLCHGRHIWCGEAWIRAAWCWFRSQILCSAWLDGAIGNQVAWQSSRYVYQKYAHVRLLQRQQSVD